MMSPFRRGRSDVGALSGHARGPRYGRDNNVIEQSLRLDGRCFADGQARWARNIAFPPVAFDLELSPVRLLGCR